MRNLHAGPLPRILAAFVILHGAAIAPALAVMPAPDLGADRAHAGHEGHSGAGGEPPANMPDGCCQETGCDCDCAAPQAALPLPIRAPGTGQKFDCAPAQLRCQPPLTRFGAPFRPPA